MVKLIVPKQLSQRNSLSDQLTTPLILFSDSAKHNSEKQWEVTNIDSADDFGTGSPAETLPDPGDCSGDTRERAARI